MNKELENLLREKIKDFEKMDHPAAPIKFARDRVTWWWVGYCAGAEIAFGDQDDGMMMIGKYFKK